MRNILNYFYQIILNDCDIDNEGYFFYNDNYWQIKKYIRNKLEIDKLMILNNYMVINNMKINKIVLNIHNEPISFYNNNYYLLLKIDYKELEKNSFNMILSPNIKDLNILYRNNWDYLWSVKIDYVEYQIEHLIHKYPLLYDTVNYYIGMAENAIMYFKMLDLKNEKLYINHRRLGREKSFFDPSELVIDYKVRDLVEYIKYNFFENNLSIDDIVSYVRKINLEKMDYILFFVRLLFPSYYFDIYDLIINGKEDEKEILKITNKSMEYERLLYNIYLIIKEKVNLLEITWLRFNNV